MRWLSLALLIATTAAAGGRHVPGSAPFGTPRLGVGNAWVVLRPPPPVYEPIYWYWTPVQQYVQPPAPIIIEREVVREVPTPPVAPQVIIIEQPPAPTPQPVVVTVAPAPAAAEPVKEAATPRVPGPDVFSWTDDDGVVHFSTRVPPEAKARAKKVGGAAR